MSLPEFFHEAAFEAEVTQLMTQAFELACKSMPGGGYPDLIKEIIAKRIVLCARRGTVDPVLLCREALSSLGLHSDGDDECAAETL